ncbi:partial N-acetyl-alpha-D-glucosaminyl L-malate synthase, partial [Anaerolineae bacterium]
IEYDKRSLKDRLEGWALRFLAQRVIVVGYIVAEAHRARLHGRSIDVIPNAVVMPLPIDPDRRLELRKQLIGDPTRPLLIAVGRLSPPKGYGDLLEAFADLRKTHPATALVIVGSGSEHPYLEEKISALGLQRDAQLLGARNDVAQLLAASDIYVSSSHWEGMPLTLLEAMATGLPVVATDVGDVPNVIANGTGIVVPSYDPANLANALRGLLDDPARMHAMGLAAKTHVSENYGVSKWFDQYLRLYAQLRQTLNALPEKVIG